MTTAAPAPPAAIAILLAEHAEGNAAVDALLQAVTAAVTSDPHSVATAREATSLALVYFEGPLERHIAREEGPLFPRLRAALPADDRLIDEMIAEHDLIRIKRDEVRVAIESVLGGHDELRDDVRRLREQIDSQAESTRDLAALQHAVRAIADKMRVHFENEEQLVFPLAPQLLDAATLDRVRDEIAATEAPPRS